MRAQVRNNIYMDIMTNDGNRIITVNLFPMSSVPTAEMAVADALDRIANRLYTIVHDEDAVDEFVQSIINPVSMYVRYNFRRCRRYKGRTK